MAVFKISSTFHVNTLDLYTCLKNNLSKHFFVNILPAVPSNPRAFQTEGKLIRIRLLQEL